MKNSTKKETSQAAVLNNTVNVEILKKFDKENYIKKSNNQLFSLRNEVHRIIKPINQRIGICGAYCIGKDGKVSVGKNKGNNVGFQGYASCETYHSCPVCGRKYDILKESEIYDILNQVEENEKHSTFATFTVPHLRNDKLKDLLLKIRKAWRSLNNSYIFSKKLKPKFKIEDYVKVLESPYSVNGWHPHFHIIFIHSEKIESKEFEKELFNAWSKIYTKLFNKKLSVLGFEVKETYSKLISSYMADSLKNISISKELTGSRNKISKYTSHYSFIGTNKEYLFIEYYKAFTETKTRRYEYSKGLLKKYNLSEKSEVEKLTELEKLKDVYFQLNVDDLKKVYKNKLHAQILNITQFEGIAAAQSFLKKFDIEIEINEYSSKVEKIENELIDLETGEVLTEIIKEETPEAIEPEAIPVNDFDLSNIPFNSNFDNEKNESLFIEEKKVKKLMPKQMVLFEN